MDALGCFFAFVLRLWYLKTDKNGGDAVRMVTYDLRRGSWRVVCDCGSFFRVHLKRKRMFFLVWEGKWMESGGQKGDQEVA
jgi:hypothetical protein